MKPGDLLVRDDGARTVGLTSTRSASGPLFHWLQRGDRALVVAYTEPAMYVRNVLLLCGLHLGWAREQDIRKCCT
jgi:hypothetical protein